MAQEVQLKFNSENRDREEILDACQNTYIEMLNPPEWLEGLESPFKWGLYLKRREFVNWNIQEKLGDYTNQGAFYGFEKLAFYLVYIFLGTTGKEMFKLYERDSEEEESSVVEDDNSSEEEYDHDPERAYVKCSDILAEMALNDGDIMYTRIGPALQHVLQATRAHMLYFNKNIAESQELARNIQPVDEMSRRCKAGFQGLRAKVVMSLYQDYRIVLPYLHKAIELDPEFGYWPYLVGKVLRRARREFKEDLGIEEELKYFEKAVSLERNPKFLVFLAQAYQETAQAMFASRNLAESPIPLQEKAVELYSECWQIKNDSAAISRRVGNGMMKFRSELINRTVAEEALLKAAELSPNDSTQIALGKFYYVHEKNDEKALEHFNQAKNGNFKCSEIIRLNLIKDPDYDPEDIMESWLELEKHAVKQYKAFCDAAWYFLVYKGNLGMAAYYLWKVLAEDKKAIRAKTAFEYRSYAFCVERPINLVELITNEILLLKAINERRPLEERKDYSLLESVLEKIVDKYPHFRDIHPSHDLLASLVRSVESNIEKKRRQRYGNFYDRRSRGREEPGAQGNNRERQWRNSTNRESNMRSGIRNNFSVRDEERKNSGYDRDDGRRNSESRGYDRDDGRRNSESRGYDGGDGRRNTESRSSWRTAGTSEVREGTSEQSESNQRFSHNDRGRSNNRQYSSYNNNRYDVTVTDWRSENRKQ